MTVMHALKKIISAEEFDELSALDQIRYWYCKHCGNFILGSWSRKCLCEEG